MSVYNKNNKFVSYLIILISLFIVVLFTKDIVKSIYENIDLKDNYTIKLDEKKDKLSKLNDLQNKLINSKEDIAKYMLEIKEDEIIDYIYSSIEKINIEKIKWENINTEKWITYVRAITISEPVDTELWFKETLINIDLKVPNEVKMKEVLDTFISKESKYNFFINSFSFPYGEKETDFTVSLPLRILHK